MKKTGWVVLYFSLLFMLLGGLFYTYESNPQVYNTLSEAGADMTFLDSLGQWEGELTGDKYYSLVDEAGRELDGIGRHVFVGDELILEDNNRYKVAQVDEGAMKAVCQLIGKEEMPDANQWDQLPVLNLAQDNKNKVAIYMTHTAESYVPTEGTDSKPGRGGILEVGQVLAQNLKNKGVTADISMNKHDPHDANAYHRSRKTAAQLLKGNPAAIIEVHRDGVPDPKFYKTTFDGQPGTKIRLVVGRQNPHMSANLDFAKQIKAYFDKNSPGLIKGIFMAKGNYNQDLSPRAILIEVGTHTNDRKAAEAGVTQFADGIPKMLGLTTAGPTAPTPGGGGGQGPGTAPRVTGTGSSMIWLVALAVLGGATFLFISTGSLKGSMKKLSGLGKEFANYLGPTRKKK